METKETQDKLKSFIENVQLQFSLGKAEAFNELEKQKENLKSFIDTAHDNVVKVADKVTDIEKMTQLNNNIEKLRLQLALGKAETKDAFEKQSESINRGIESFREDLKEKYPELTQKLDDSSHKINSVMESLKLQFALGKPEVESEAKHFQSVVTEKLNDLKARVDEGKEIAEVSLENLKGDTLDAFTKLIVKFKSFSSKK